MKALATTARWFLLLPALVGGTLASGAAEGEGEARGPDVTVISIGAFSDPVRDGELVGYSFGTDACNVGDAPLWWCDDDRVYCSQDQHPVIAQHLYRWSDGRFEQIGKSWLKHGFISNNRSDPACGATCASPPHGSDQLGVGCADFYSSTANGRRPLGPRFEIDPSTVEMTFPPTEFAFAGSDQLLQLRVEDIDPAENPGARYFAEAHYLAADDAAAGNDLNNTSYREVWIDSFLKVRFVGDTVREAPALFAWVKLDGNVMISTVDRVVPEQAEGGGRLERFHVARRFTHPAPGRWRYEYTVHNLNSRRAAGRFSVRFLGPVEIDQVGFRGLAHQNGEPYSSAAWVAEVDDHGVSWSTEPHEADPDANALRWGTSYSFWFEANTDPMSAVFEIEPFEPAELETGIGIRDSGLDRRPDTRERARELRELQRASSKPPR